MPAPTDNKDMLDPRWELYAQARASGKTQRQSYIQAFNAESSSSKTVDDKAYALEKRFEVKSRIQELLSKKAEESSWTVEKLIAEFTEVKDICKQAMSILDRHGNPTGEYKIDSMGAVKSLENIGKLLGYYTQNINHSGNIGVQIIDDIVKADIDDIDDEEGVVDD